MSSCIIRLNPLDTCLFKGTGAGIPVAHFVMGSYLLSVSGWDIWMDGQCTYIMTLFYVVSMLLDNYDRQPHCLFVSQFLSNAFNSIPLNSENDLETFEDVSNMILLRTYRLLRCGVAYPLCIGNIGCSSPRMRMNRTHYGGVRDGLAM
jgi:hypothetical protein